MTSWHAIVWMLEFKLQKYKNKHKNAPTIYGRKNQTPSKQNKAKKTQTLWESSVSATEFHWPHSFEMTTAHETGPILSQM